MEASDIPRLKLRRARDRHTHMGSCTHTSTLALKGCQLSLTYSSDTILFRFFLNWYLVEHGGGGVTGLANSSGVYR